MAGVKISNLPAIVSPTLTDIYPSVQSGVTYKVTVQQLNSLLVTTLVTPANGGIVYTDATQLQLLAPTATARQLLLSGANVTPVWSTTTYPLANAINTLLYASSANVMAALATGNNGTLITSAGGVPSISSTLPSAVQANITQLGTQSQALNMGTHQINNVTDPTGAQDAATKAYVDAVAQGLTIQGACRVATTGALTVTYANGASGVGATLTNAGAFAALVIDGVTLAVNDRVLVKNQAAPAQNGIYTATVLGDGISVNWVMTRSTDYDQPAEINPGDLVLITAGTANANSSWVETATIVTVGTDSISFSQFSASLPISLANGGTGAALTASNGGIFYSNATTGAILAGTATAGKVLQSGASTTPAWSTPTYPSASGSAGQLLRSDGTNNIYTAALFASTYSASNLLYSNGADNVTGLATSNTATLQTNSSGVPSWVSGIPIKSINTQSITATGAFTYSPTAGCAYAIFELQAAGGGSGGATGAGGQSAASGAGGGGSYQKILVSGAANLAAITGSIGAAGAAGSSGNNAGGNGGNTTLQINAGSIWTAGGGIGGGGQTSSASGKVSGTPGIGGTNTTGTNGTLIFGAPGQNGSYGWSNGVVTDLILYSNGGNSQLGKGGVGSSAGLNYGGGASGIENGTGADAAGMAGAQGIVIITEFCIQ